MNTSVAIMPLSTGAIAKHEGREAIKETIPMSGRLENVLRASVFVSCPLSYIILSVCLPLTSTVCFTPAHILYLAFYIYNPVVLAFVLLSGNAQSNSDPSNVIVCFFNIHSIL